MPVLLPGVQQEFTRRMLRALGDDLCDPFALKVAKPHRLCSTSALSLTALDRFRSPSLIQRANFHCGEIQRSNPDSGAVLLNGDLCNVMAQAMSRRKFGQGESVEHIVRQIQKGEDAVGKLRAQREIPEEKSTEWLAFLGASRAYVITSGSERRGALEIMKDNLRRRVRLSNAKRYLGVPDLVVNDPIYRLVVTDHDGPKGFAEFLTELHSIAESTAP